MLHLIQQIIDGFRFGNQVDRAKKFRQGPGRGRQVVPLPLSQEVTLVYESLDVVEIVAENGNP